VDAPLAELPKLSNSVLPPPPPPIQTDSEALAAIYEKLDLRDENHFHPVDV